MTEPANLPSRFDHTLEQVIARAHYEELRDRLVVLRSAPEPDMAAIDAVIQALEKAQMVYKATHGLFGNNAGDDPLHTISS
ncbi:MAG: hypothetical protein V4858_10760 [Pseudomonadota bacterium]